MLGIVRTIRREGMDVKKNRKKLIIPRYEFECMLT
jgi:hypothetical protein